MPDQIIIMTSKKGKQKPNTHRQHRSQIFNIGNIKMQNQLKTFQLYLWMSIIHIESIQDALFFSRTQFQ